jgi:hypothetical protein
MELTCPCCQKSVTEAKLSNTIELLESNDCAYEATDEFPLTFALPYSKWACDDCLKNKKAVLADINKQRYSLLVRATQRPFYLVYAPWESVCKRCQETFEVSIEQQQRCYEVLKWPMRIAPTHCLACEGKPSKARWDLTRAKSHKPMTKKKLNKQIAAAKANNELEKVQKYQVALDKLNVEIEAETRKQIAELTQNGEREPTDERTAKKLMALYQIIDDRENLKKCNKRILFLKWEWWDKNIKPTLDPASIVVKDRLKSAPKKNQKPVKVKVNDTPVNVESQPVLEKTPIARPVEPQPVLEKTPIPVKKPKKIQKPVLEKTPIQVKDTPVELLPVLETTPIPVKVHDTLVELPPVLETTPIQVKDTPAESPPVLETIPVKVHDTLVELPAVLETAPIQLKDTPVKKEKKKRIVKSVVELQSLKFKAESAEENSLH